MVGLHAGHRVGSRGREEEEGAEDGQVEEGSMNEEETARLTGFLVPLVKGNDYQTINQLLELISHLFSKVDFSKPKRKAERSHHMHIRKRRMDNGVYGVTVRLIHCSVNE